MLYCNVEVAVEVVLLRILSGMMQGTTLMIGGDIMLRFLRLQLRHTKAHARNLLLNK